MLITRAKTFDEIHRAFRWQLPERMNIATVVCDRHAARSPDSVALLHEHGDGSVATFSFRDISAWPTNARTPSSSTCVCSAATA